MEFLDGQTLKHPIIRAADGNLSSCSTSPSQSPTRSTLRIARASSIATSSRRTFSSPSAATPRFSTSAWPKVRQRRIIQPAFGRCDSVRPAVSEQHLTSPGSDAWHRGLHVAGAGAGQGPGRAHGSVFLRRRALRDGNGHACPFAATATAAIFERHSAQRPPITPVRLNPDLPPKLEDIINKALEKDRNLRYQHAADMRADLQRLKRDTESGRKSAAVERRSR